MLSACEMVILGSRIVIFKCKCAIVTMHGDCTMVHGRGILRGTCALFTCVCICLVKRDRGTPTSQPENVVHMCFCALEAHFVNVQK